MIKANIRNTLTLASLALGAAATDSCYVKTELREQEGSPDVCPTGYVEQFGVCY